MASNSSGSDGAKPNNSPPLLARPDFVSREVPDPDAEVGGIDGQAHARLALAQPGLARLKLVDELRRAEHVAAQLVPHHRDQAHVERAEDNRHLDVAPNHRATRAESEPSRKNSTLPPTISAFRRSPRRHAVTLASATKMQDKHHANWASSVTGLGTPAEDGRRIRRETGCAAGS